MLQAAATHRSFIAVSREKSHGKYLRYIAWNASVCLNCFKARVIPPTKDGETRVLPKQTYNPPSITLWDKAARSFRLVRRADGIYRWFHVRGFPIRDTDGQLVRWCVLQTDIDDRKKAEAAAHENDLRYRKVQMELAHANRVATMGELTGSIAHEVNQPIAACITNAQTAVRWLDREPPNAGRARQAISQVIADGRRAADIVGGIRALVKKEPPQKGSLEMNEAILEVIELTRARLSDQRVVLETELAQGLQLVQGDRVQLQQVIMNLIVNAVEAMSEMSDGDWELLIGTLMEGGEVTVVVRDSGPGLSDDNFDKIFDAFHTTMPTGRGVGLSICRSIVENHGGPLWASANVPKAVVLQLIVPALTDGSSVAKA